MTRRDAQVIRVRSSSTMINAMDTHRAISCRSDDPNTWCSRKKRSHPDSRDDMRRDERSGAGSLHTWGCKCLSSCSIIQACLCCGAGICHIVYVAVTAVVATAALDRAGEDVEMTGTRWVQRMSLILCDLMKPGIRRGCDVL